MGPTASGKSALALALARRFAVEIVSVDSAQVFRDMDVGTAKPDAATRAAVPHHLIDIVSPEDSYSAGAFQRDAARLIEEIPARGRLPLLVGGTMLYFKALREGLAELPAADAGIRREIDARAARLGWPALHTELARLDPATAGRLAPNDAQRIQRALEIVRLTGKPLDETRRRTGRAPLAARGLAIALMPSDRARLHERIARRFDAMLAAGLIDEVARLRRRYRLDARLPSMRCVGYRQVWGYLEGQYDRAALREKAIAATRQLAKRQLTWLRAMPDTAMFDCLAPDLEQRVLAYLRTRGVADPPD
jgi:tRNA dimethylallyltransferase